MSAKTIHVGKIQHCDFSNFVDFLAMLMLRWFPVVWTCCILYIFPVQSHCKQTLMPFCRNAIFQPWFQQFKDWKQWPQLYTKHLAIQSAFKNLLFPAKYPASLNLALSATYSFYQLFHTSNNFTVSEFRRAVGQECVGTAFTHLFQVLLWNEFKAVLKWLGFWVVPTPFLLVLHHWWQRHSGKLGNVHVLSFFRNYKLQILCWVFT